MDECVAEAVAEAVAVAVTEAVAEADQSIHDPSIHDPSIYREVGLKPRNMNNSFFKKSSQKHVYTCLLYTSPSPRDGLLSRMPSSA